MSASVPERVTEARTLLDDNRMPTMHVVPDRGFEMHELWIFPPNRERFVVRITDARYAVFDASGKMHIHTAHLDKALQIVKRIYVKGK